MISYTIWYFVLINIEASSFKKCDKRRSDFNQCLSDVVYEGFKVLDKPLKSHGLPSLHDIEYPPDVIIEIGNSTYGLEQKFSKLRIIGLSKPESVTARLEFGPVVSTLTIEASYIEIIWQMKYDAQGTTVLLPLNVQTSLDLILRECSPVVIVKVCTRVSFRQPNFNFHN